MLITILDMWIVVQQKSGMKDKIKGLAPQIYFVTFRH